MSILEKFPDVAEVQAKLDETLAVATQDFKGSRNSVFEAVSQTEDQIVEFGLGRIGKALKEFASRVDYGHPTVERLHDGIFLEGSHFFAQVQETLVLAKYAKEKGLKTMPETISTWFNHRYGETSKVLLKPPASVLKTSEARQAVRDIPKVRDIDLSSHYATTGVWEAIWPSCKPFVRMGDGFKDQIAYNEKVIARLTSMSAVSSAAFLRSQNETLRAANSDNYCGFVRLLMTDAALNLAKVMNFEWSQDLGRIVVPKERLSIPVADGSAFLYNPRTYPLSKYPAPLSDKMKAVLGTLESHPDANGRPLFDMYWIVVPGISVGRAAFHDGTTRQTFDTFGALYDALDACLIERGDIVPILLGENVIEHKCYFISYVV